jgi:hypothetical protein
MAGTVTSIHADLLPGWTMYFIDFDSGANLALKVTQTDPVEEDVDFVGSSRTFHGSSEWEACHDLG